MIAILTITVPYTFCFAPRFMLPQEKKKQNCPLGSLALYPIIDHSLAARDKIRLASGTHQ